MKVIFVSLFEALKLEKEVFSTYFILCETFFLSVERIGMLFESQVLSMNI